MSLLSKIPDDFPNTGLSSDLELTFSNHDIWGMYLNDSGTSTWIFHVPDEVPTSFSLSEVASFSKGYLKDYPVFLRSMKEGIFILGYPKNSYMKILHNYYPLHAIKNFPFLVLFFFTFDILLFFLAFMLYKQKIRIDTEPITEAIEALSKAKPVKLDVNEELKPIAESVNAVSSLISKQNEARANWISGVSHDIRTPLSIILGYSEKIMNDCTVSELVQSEADIICSQSMKIKDLIQDLNLVSQLEYDMQPLKLEKKHLSKLIRGSIVELMNTGLYDSYEFDIDIQDQAELFIDSRLISRAIANLIMNSIKHNPDGCQIAISLYKQDNMINLRICDDGIGVDEEQMHHLIHQPHYMNSTDESLNLRHGLGLLIVEQIAQAHHGSLRIEQIEPHGFMSIISLPYVQ